VISACLGFAEGKKEEMQVSWACKSTSKKCSLGKSN